ncbi:hypothetical protein [Rhodocyclus gracilis]|uniref:Uncharacterized protein n=1 Tax=Rhodocyclus tenuis TaxID=1066 RepID=A0A6L5JYZ3_RHOTE|nr:hypothetical protein [Rhodocyclus gracilis]MQY52533.1 hypothetical protein [Rhodocyclus gracilis]
MKKQQGKVGIGFFIFIGCFQFVIVFCAKYAVNVPDAVLGYSALIAFLSFSIINIVGDTSVVVGTRQDKTNQLLEQLLEEKKRENAMKSRRRRPTQKNEDVA